MTTVAKPISSEGSHWYFPDGQPCYELPYADPRKGMRPTTLADARKLGLLPSPTTILRVLYKPSLVDWLIEQACLAVLTTPKAANEELDAFVQRVLHVEKVQDQESQIAKDRGTEMHSGLEDAMQGKGISLEMEPWIGPAFREIATRGKTVSTETVVVGQGYAGKVDLIQENNELWVWDYKTTKKLPNPDKGGAWPEHRLQASAYAAALALRGTTGDKRIRTGNIYISTVEQGAFVVCQHEDWEMTYEQGFKPLLQVWQYLNGYRP